MYYNLVLNEVLSKFKKEYFCHLIYVEKTALTLQEKLWGDLEIIRIAAIWHDIWRVDWWDNSLHPEKWAEIIYDLLMREWYDKVKAQQVARCTLMHNKIKWFESLEEQIVSNADTLSKLLYNDMFMLMCKKEDYISKARWGLKYIEKWYNNLTFDFLKVEYKDLYTDLQNRYSLIINN